MAFSAAQDQKIQQWIKAKFPQGMRCPMCGQTKLSILPDLYADNLIGTQETTLGGGVLVVTALCGNCSHVVSFAAKPMGLA